MSILGFLYSGLYSLQQSSNHITPKSFPNLFETAKKSEIVFFLGWSCCGNHGLPSSGNTYSTVLYTSPQKFVHINCVWRHQSWISEGFCDMYSASLLAWFLVSDCCLLVMLFFFPAEPLQKLANIHHVWWHPSKASACRLHVLWHVLVLILACFLVSDHCSFCKGHVL